MAIENPADQNAALGDLPAATDAADFGGREISVAALRNTRDQVGDVADRIAVIAGQTNLLALDAMIEAAQKGDAGRGFAAAAGGVKALTGQSAQAVRVIAQTLASLVP